jgi:hypothetical protein
MQRFGSIVTSKQLWMTVQKKKERKSLPLHVCKSSTIEAIFIWHILLLLVLVSISTIFIDGNGVLIV